MKKTKKDMEYYMNNMYTFFNDILYLTDLLCNKDVHKPYHEDNLMMYRIYMITFAEKYMDINIFITNTNYLDYLNEINNLSNFSYKKLEWDQNGIATVAVKDILYTDIDKLKELILEFYKHDKFGR